MHDTLAKSLHTAGVDLNAIASDPSEKTQNQGTDNCCSELMLIERENEEEAFTIITVPPRAGPDMGSVESAVGSDTNAYFTEDALI